MDILMSETCWAHKKWNKIASDIKLVFYSSNITMMHGPINIRFLILGFASRVVIPIETTQESKGAMLSRLYSIKRVLVSLHSLLFTTKKKQLHKYTSFKTFRIKIKKESFLFWRSKYFLHKKVNFSFAWNGDLARLNSHKEFYVTSRNYRIC